MLGIAAAAILAGAIVAAVTASGGSGSSTVAHTESAPRRHGPGNLAVAAGYLGLTRAQLRKDEASGQTLAHIAETTGGKSATGLIDALVSAETARLNAAVRTHKVTPAREQVRLARLRRRLTALVDRGGAARVAGVIGTGVNLHTAAGYLGVTPAQLRADLRAGRSLAQVADATPGKSATGLTETLVNTRKAKLEAAVAAGTLTQSRETVLVSALPQRVAAAVNRTRKQAGHAQAQPGSAAPEAEAEIPESEAP